MEPILDSLRQGEDEGATLTIPATGDMPSIGLPLTIWTKLLRVVNESIGNELSESIGQAERDGGDRGE